MSTNDKTADQLANTIRKAKTGTSAAPSPAPVAAKPAAPAKKAAPKKKAAPAKKKTTSPAAKKSAASTPAADSFQHGRRVWPD
jgi:hypothetical protein